MLHPPAEAHSGPSQVSMTDFFVRIRNGFKLNLPSIFVESSTVDVWRALNTPLASSNAGN